MGFALAGASYRMGKHHATLVGRAEETPNADAVVSEERVRPHQPCSLVVAHADEYDDLIWYQQDVGRLTKAADTMLTLARPASQQWVVNGDLQGDADGGEIGCGFGSVTHRLTYRETEILEKCLEESRSIDVVLDSGSANRSHGLVSTDG